MLALRFIYRGFKNEYYYWELVIFIKKMILIFIGSFTDMFPAESKAPILLVVISIFLLIQVRVKPYERTYLNNIETLSLLVSFLSANIGIMLYSDDLKKTSTYFLGLMITFNISFLLYWLMAFYKLKHRSKKIA